MSLCYAVDVWSMNRTCSQQTKRVLSVCGMTLVLQTSSTFACMHGDKVHVRTQAAGIPPNCLFYTLLWKIHNVLSRRRVNKSPATIGTLTGKLRSQFSNLFYVTRNWDMSCQDSTNNWHPVSTTFQTTRPVVWIMVRRSVALAARATQQSLQNQWSHNYCD